MFHLSDMEAPKRPGLTKLKIMMKQLSKILMNLIISLRVRFNISPLCLQNKRLFKRFKVTRQKILSGRILDLDISSQERLIIK